MPNIDDLLPVTRKEKYLYTLAGETVTPPTAPVQRVEVYLAYLCGDTTLTLPSPVTREEKYLAYLCGEPVDLPQPVTRMEKILAALCDMDVDDPTPVTREEIFAAAVERSRTVTLAGTLPLTLVNSVAKALTSLIQYGATTQPAVDYLATVTQSGAVEQNGTPSPSTPMDIWCNNGKLVARHQSGLPLAYTKLDTIIMTPASASDFSQVLDTGLKCTEKTEIRCGFKATDSTNRFAYGASTSNPRLTLYRNGSGGNSRFGNEVVSKSISSGVAHDVVHNATALTIDGVSSAYAAQSAFTTADNITIGNCNGNTGTPPFLGEWYYYQHIEDGVLLRDYVPATDGTHHGLYDKVNGTFLWAEGITGGSAASDPVEIYYDGTPATITDADGHEATLAPLLAVGSYKDTQEVIAGAVTRNVGVYVVTGAEEWAEAGTTSTAIIAGATTTWGAVAGVAPICTRLVGLNAGETTFAGACRFANDFNVYEYKTAFGVSNITEFKAKLAAAYAAGTPVIILFAKATATTESASPQLLTNAPLTTVAEVTLPAAVTTTAAVRTPDPNHPLPLVCNNGALLYGVYSKNILNPTAIRTGYYIDANGVEQEASSNPEQYHIRQAVVEPNTTYTASLSLVNAGYTNRYHAYDADGNWIEQVGTIGSSAPLTFTTPANCKYIRQGGRDQADYQLEAGSTATAYVPFAMGIYGSTPETLTVSDGTNTQSVTNIPNKLAVGTYKDEYEFVSGLMTHKVGVYVVTGTEATKIQAGMLRVTVSLPREKNSGWATRGMCTHGVCGSASSSNAFVEIDGEYIWFGGLFISNAGITDAESGSAFLAAQYAAGTPVIIIYPLATETTEQLTPHALETYDGTTVIDATSGTDNSFEVTYSVSQYPAVTISVSGTTMTLTAPNELDTITQSGHTLRIT